MPTTFRRKGTLPEINSWNALYNRASGNALWSDSTFSGLDNPTLQANYIAMLAGNTQALQDRLPQDFQFASANTQYSVLATLNSFTQEELQMSDKEYAQSQQNKINQAFNEQITGDENFQQYGGINEFVRNNYSGDYSKFYQEYGSNYEGFMSPENLENISYDNYTGVTPESTKEAFDYLSSAYKEIETRYSKERDITWTKLLDQIELEKTEYLKRKAWDEASIWEKAGSTLATYLAMPFTEAGEVIEGLVDSVASIAMGITNLFGADEAASNLREFVGKDIIPLDTMLKEALPNSWATSDYTAWYNPAKLIYNTTTSIVDMAPMALNLVVPGLGTALYYASSAGRTAEATIQENPDWSTTRITLYTAGATAIEWATEHISGDSIFGPGWFSKYTNIGATKVGKAVNKALQQPAIKMVKEALGEGLEEVVSEFGSSLLEGIMTGDFDSAFEDFGTNAVQSFVIGAAVGGVISVSSSAKINRLVNKVHKQITTAEGGTVTLSMAQSVVVDNFLTEMDDRIAKGLTLSEKNQARYDALKSLQIKDMDEAAAKSLLNSARRKSYLNMRGNIRYTIGSTQTTEVAVPANAGPDMSIDYSTDISYIRGTDINEYTYTTELGDINDYSTLESVFNTTGTISYDSEGDITYTDAASQQWYNIPEDMSSKLSTEASMLLTLQTDSLIKTFGQEALTNGLHLFEQYTIKTVDDIIKFGNFKQQKMSESDNALREQLIAAFGDDLDIVFTTRSQNELRYLGADIRTLVSEFSNHQKISKVQTFVTTKSNMPTMFVYERNGKPILFINNSLLTVHSFGTLIRMSAACQAVYYWANEITKIPAVNDLVNSFLDRANISTVPRSVQRQQLLYMAAFVEGNPIANAIAWRDYDAYMQVKEVFEQLVFSFGNQQKNMLQLIRAEVANVAGQGLRVYDSTILSNINQDDIEAYRKDLSSNVTDVFIDDRLSEEDFTPHYRTTPYLYFGENVNRQAVMLITALQQFAKDFGFNYDCIKDCTLEQGIAKLFNRQNYTDDGINALNKALERYDHISDYNFRTRLNYYLQDNFGFSITADNTIISNDFVAELLNIDRLNELLAEDEVEFSLSDVLTARGREKLGPNFLDVPIIYRDRRPEDDRTHPDAKAWFQANTTTSGAYYGGEIVIIRGTSELTYEYDGWGTGVVSRNGPVFANAYTQLAIHEIQHCITEITHGVNSVARYITPDSLPLYIRKLVTSKPKIKLFYDFLIKRGIIEKSDFPDVDSFAKSKADLEKYLKNEKFNRVVAASIYFSFDLNEGLSRGENFRISDTEVINALDTNVNVSNDFTGFAILYTNSRDPFIQLFNNQVIHYQNTKMKDYLSLLESAKITNDDMISRMFSDYSAEDATPFEVSDSESAGSFVTMEELARLFSKDNIPEDLSVLATKDYWIDKATSPDLRVYIGSLSDLQFKRYLQRFTGLSLDVISKAFVPKFNAAEVELSRDTNYGGIIAKDSDGNLRVISTANPNAAFSQYSAEGIIMWNAKARTAIFNFNTHKLSKEVLAVMNRLNQWTREGGKQRFIVNDRIFNNAVAASAYLNTQPKQTVAENSTLAANFDALFTKITETAIKGPLAIYNLDTIFITNDGQIYNMDSNGNLLQTLKDMCETDSINTIGQVSVDPITGEAIPDEDGLNRSVNKLFRDKKVVRLSKVGDNWVAYGIPNILQDNFIKLMRAEAVNHSYLLERDIGYNIRKSGLIIDGGKVKVKYADADGNIAGQEVPWRTSKWYGALCNIISKYQLTSVAQLKRLGFSDDFVEHITNYTGRRMSEKTRRFYNVNKAENVYNGIDHSYVIQYINDDTNTELSRNILIANCPDSTAESGNLDWKQNAHIHTVKDAKDYLKAVETFWTPMTIAADNNVYGSISELQAAYAGKINSNDSRYIRLSATMADAAQSTGKITAVLNDDARKVGNVVTPRDGDGNITSESYINKIYHNGLDLSLIAFTNVKYRMEQGEYKLEVETVEDTQTGRHKDEEDSVSLSDRKSAQENYGNVETMLINRENQEALNQVIDEINKANKDTNLESRLNKLQNVLDSLPEYDLDIASEKRIRNQLETAIKGIANRTISRLEESGIQAEINRISESLQRVNTLTGQERAQAQAENDAAYAKFKNDRIRNIVRFGEEGYRKILSVYSQNNATQMNNITSKFSHFFRRLNAARGNTGPSATQQYYQQLMATQVPNGNKLQLMNDFYDRIQETLRTGNNTKLTNFLSNTLQPYIYNAIKDGNYNFTSAIDRQLLEIAEGIVAKQDISESEKAATLMNIIDGYTQEDSDEQMSKEAKLRIEAMIDQLVPEDTGPIEISDSSEAKSYINLDKLKNILGKTLDTNTVSTVAKTVNQIDMQRKKKDAALDTSVAERWKAIKQENFEINYVTGIYDRMLKEYRKMADSTPVTTEDMKDALRGVYDFIMSADLNNPNRTTIFDTTRNVFVSKARTEWREANEDKAKFLREKAYREEVVANEFAKLYPEESGLINQPRPSMDRSDPRFEAYRNADIKFAEFRNRYLHDTTEEYQEERRRYIDARVRALRAEGGTEFQRVQRNFKQYVEDNTYRKRYSPTLLKRLNGLNIVLTEFNFAPKTQAAIDKLNNDVRTVLQDGRLNDYVRGDTNRQLISISAAPNDPDAVLRKFKDAEYTDRSNVMDEIITTQSEQYKEVLRGAAERIAGYYDTGNPENVVSADTDIDADTDEVTPDMFAPSGSMAMTDVFDESDAIIEIGDMAAKDYINLDRLKNILGKTLKTDTVGNVARTVNQVNMQRQKKETRLDTTVAENWRAIKRATSDINYVSSTYDRLIRQYRNLSNSPAVTTEQMRQALKDVYRMITEDTNPIGFSNERNAMFDITRDVDREKAREEWISNNPDAVAFMGDKNLRNRLAHEEFAKRFPSKADIIKNKPAYMNLPDRQKILDEAQKDYEDFTRRYIREKVADYRKSRSDYIRYSVEAARRSRHGEGNYRIDRRGWKEYLNDNIHYKQASTTLIKRINGLRIAYAEFCVSPKTEATIAKLMTDVRTIMIDGRLNDYLRGTTNQQLLQISDKLPPRDEGKDANTVVNEVMDLFKNGDYVDRSHVVTDAMNKAESQYRETLQKTADSITRYLDTTNTVTATPEASVDMFGDSEESMSEVTPDMFAPSDSMAMSEDDFFTDLGLALDELSGYPDNRRTATEQPVETPVNETVESTEQTVTTETQTTDRRRKPPRPESEIFEELNTEDAKMHKTINSRNLYAYGVDIRPAFQYVFEKKESRSLLGKPFDRQIFNTEEFRKNPTIAGIINELKTNERAARAFVEWAANRPSINSEYQSRMLILLNIIRTAPELSVDVRTAAREIFEVERSASARNLGLFKYTGLTPTEELCEIALANFSLTPDEKLNLQEIINRQNKAIEEDNYAEADKATEDMLKIFENHKNELDNSINFFNAKTPDERANRLRNFANRINAFRYFAMLSMPATFFTRNVASNAILTAMDKTASGISTIAMKGVEKIAGTEGQYKRTAKRVSDDAKQVTNQLLVENGLVDSILNNTVSKYDTGYDYNTSALEKIGMDDLLDDPNDERVRALNNKLNEKTPFGTGNFGRFLNNLYNKIFGIMDKYDKVFMRRRIIEMTQKLVSDNFTSEQIQRLKDGDETLRHRFDDMVEYSKLEATKIYLRSMPQLYRSIMAALDKYPVAKVLTSIILPFPRMLINTTMTALAYSPFGLIKAGLTLARDKSSFRNITASQQLGRAVVGTTGMLLGALLASLGMLAIDDDDEYAGPQLVLFGKFAMSLENLSPASLPFIVGATMASDSTANVWDALLTGGNALFDATFIGELINSFGGNKEPVDIISNTFASFVTQFIPSFIRRAAQVIDPHQKDTSGDWKFVKRIIQAIPGASLLLDNKIDPYTGEDLTRYTNNNNPWLSRALAIFNAIFPLQTKYLEESEIETESEAVDAATTGPARTYTIDGVTYKLSNEQYNDYRRLRAQLYSQYANELINTDRYKRMSIENKRSALKSLQNRATQDARKQLKLAQYAR